PESCRGLARYLAKYVASPPIAVRRIVRYDGQRVTYWYLKMAGDFVGQKNGCDMHIKEVNQTEFAANSSQLRAE
ncbi:MAG: transposase, partial [Thermodesulfobacteriota bacterium]|nr:transposase [Thermodesulfobacteriota bacterium]